MGRSYIGPTAAVLVILAAAGGALGQITLISANRALSVSAHASAPPDYFNYGDSYSNSNTGLEDWGDGNLFGPSVSSTIGHGTAIAGATNSSQFRPDNIQTVLSGRAESSCGGSGSAVANGHSTLALRFSVAASTHVVMSGSGSNSNGSFNCSLTNAGGGSVFLLTNPVLASDEFTLAPGTYDLSIAVHCSAATSGGATHIEQTHSNFEMRFSPEPCSADFNGDTTVDFFDYLDFVDAFSSNSPGADFNGDLSIDFFDYLDFVDAFSTGC